jgi:hypothetical protein
MLSNSLDGSGRAMLSEAESEYVFTHAWVPEHLVDYVVAVSGKEPFLLEDFLFYLAGRDLTVVGYPLARPFLEQELREALEEAKGRFRPSHVSVLAARLPAWRSLRPHPVQDHYFRLDLEGTTPGPNVRNMLRRASREIHLQEGRELSQTHLNLLAEFLATRELSVPTRGIMMALPRYVERVAGCSLWSAWDSRGNLAGFTVGQMGGGEYGFHMFQLRSRSCRVPGCSDLLLWALVQRAREQGKRYLNLGLGINPGVAFFKEKWGAVPFVPHHEGSYSPWDWRSLLGGILLWSRREA